MKVTLIPKPYGWMLMRIETDFVCTKIDISAVFPPFREMYTWLGRIRDLQLPAEMIIDEEGYGVILIAKRVKDNIEFSVQGWLRNEDIIYLKTIVEPNAFVKSFYQEIVDLIEKQFNQTNPSFIVEEESLNWDSLLIQPDKPQDWNKRLAIYGGGKGRCPETNLDNFSLTLKQEYLVNLKNGLNQIYRLALSRHKKQLGKLVDFYRELAIDIALDRIDPYWYEQEKEKLNTKYKIDDCLEWKTRKERIEDNKKQSNLRHTRLKTLKIGQVVDGTIFGLRSYGVFVDIGGFRSLLHISNISQLPVEYPQQVFSLNDWVRAIIVYLDIEKGRVGLSTQDLESEPGQIRKEPWAVYQNAEVMAEKYEKTRSDSSSQSYP